MRQKIVGLILCIALLLTMLVSAPSSLAVGDTPYQIIRVKLSMGTPAAVPFYLDGNYSVAQDEAVSLPRQAYTVTLAGSVLSLNYGGTVLYTGTEIRLVQHTATEGRNNFIRINNDEHGYRNYLGDIEFFIYEGYIRVINHIYLEQYLYGVVPHEMHNSWLIEALKAQAVAARTYAVRYMKYEDTHDVFDTATHQVYKGFTASYTKAHAAVDGTSKTVLTCGGDLNFVQTFYSASNGGYTDIPQHLWSADAERMPYHVIQEDTYDADNVYSSQEVLIFPKTVTETDEITYQYSSSGTMATGSGNEATNAERYLKVSCLPAVAEQGYIAGVTGDVQIVSFGGFVPHTHEGKHVELDYNGENACVCYENADVTMTVLAYKYSDSTPPDFLLGDCNGDGQITISDYTLVRLHILELSLLGEDALTAADVNGDGQITISDYTLVRLHILELSEIEQPGSPGELVQEPVTVTFTIDMHEFDDTGGLYQAFNRSLRLFVVEETDTSFNLYHRRYGHGVGLSQRGTQQRANDGHLYQAILSFYYPNTEYSVLDIAPPTLTTIDPAPSSANATISSSSGYLNVRSTPDSSSSGNIVGTLPDNARVEVTQAYATPDWHAINFGSVTAYIHKDYVVLD